MEFVEIDPSIKLPIDDRKLHLHTDIIVSRPQWPRELSAELTDDQRIEFESIYGQVSRMPVVPYEIPLIQAVMAFWNKRFHCFTFGEFDLAPTVEEYRHLLGFAQDAHSHTYWPRPERISVTKIAAWTGFAEARVREKLITIDGELGYNVKDVMDMYKEIKGKWGLGSAQEVQAKMTTLAWFIYGLFLLPVRKDFIHLRVIQMLWYICYYQEDPSNVILAETYAAISLNASNQVKAFRASPGLLHIWLISHLYRRESLPVMISGSNCSNVIAKARSYSLSSTTLPQWRDHLLRLSRVQWRAPWLPMAAIQYTVTTGEKLHVTLVGLWHVVSYAPLILARQFGDKQQHPRGIESCNYLQRFDAEQDQDLVNRFMSDWKKHSEKLSSRGMLLDPQPLYRFWRAKGTGSFRPPPAWNHGQPSGVKGPPQQKESKKRIRTQLEEAIVELNGKVEGLTKENQSLKKGESCKEKQIHMAQRQGYNNQKRNAELINHLKTQSEISNRLQKDKVRLKHKITEMEQEVDILNRMRKMNQKKRAQAEATVMAQASEIRRLEKAEELAAKEADDRLREREEEKGKRLQMEDTVDMLETHIDEVTTVYRMREQDFYRGGSFALAKVQEACSRLESIGPSVYASGNILIAEEIQQVIEILEECMGKRIAQPFGTSMGQKIQEEEDQAMVPASVNKAKCQDQEMTDAWEDNEASILGTINEDPGDF